MVVRGSGGVVGGAPGVVAEGRADSVRPSMRISLPVRACLSCAVLLLAAVVASAAAPRTQPTPFKFAALGVANPCFVDSVVFADTYLGGRKSGGSRWVRVLRWGTLEEDYTMGPGHAVAVFQWRGGLYVFDINNGVRKLMVPVARRGDLHDLTTAIYSLYPEVKPTGPALLDDSWTTRKPGLRGADKSPVTASYRDALKAGKALAKTREVRLVRFSYAEKGKRRESAVAVFRFDGRLCLYVPERGTLVLPQVAAGLDDDALIRARLGACFGRESAVQLVAPQSAEVPAAGRTKGKSNQSANTP